MEVNTMARHTLHRTEVNNLVTCYMNGPGDFIPCWVTKEKCTANINVYGFNFMIPKQQLS
jgi:hypothetical protein